MATFPTGIKTFTTKTNGQVVEPAHMNDLQDEVTALETFLRSELFQQVTTTSLLTGTAFVPTWSSTGSAPAIGNGTIAGTYWRIGKLIFFIESLILGSTSTVGTGTYTFTIPGVAANVGAVAFGVAVDASAALTYGVNCVLSDTTHLVPYPTNVAGSAGITPTVPFTWTTSDALYIAGFFWST